LRWKYEATAESPRGPKLDAVKIDQDLLSMPLRVLWIPRGMRSEEARPTPSLFEQLLQEASTHVQITSVLAEETPRSPLTKKRIAIQQEQFVASIMQADYAAKLIKHVLPDYDAQALIDRQKDLRRQNAELAKERRYDVPSGPAKAKSSQVAALARTQSDPLGTPILLPPAASSLTLQSLADRWYSEQHTRSELVLLGAVALVLLSLFRQSFSLAGRVAPEIVAAAAMVAMLLFGVSFLGVTAIGLAIFVRFAWILAALRTRMTQHDPASTVAASAPPPEAHSS
jgi:hypothetical protein